MGTLAHKSGGMFVVIRRRLLAQPPLQTLSLTDGVNARFAARTHTLKGDVNDAEGGTAVHTEAENRKLIG